MKKLTLIAALLTVATVTVPAVAQDGYRDQYRDRDQNGGRDQYRGRGPHITVFADDDFRGRAMEITGPISRLGPTGMEDKISSIVVDSGTWLVCVDDDFRGRCETIDHSVRRLSRMGLDDKISSIRPTRGRYRGR
jgi:hypothetical protein